MVITLVTHRTARNKQKQSYIALERTATEC